MVSLPPGVTAEIKVDGAWQALPVRTGTPVTLSRGASSEGSRTQPGKAGLSVDNRDGEYSPHNPNSSLFGKIGRNTRFRVGVHAGTPDLAVTAAGDRATTPDAASLDITGDIDVRVEVSLDDWNPTEAVELAGKYDFGADERSWLLFVGGTNRELILRWSADGVANHQFGSTEPIPVPQSGRIALRSTLDVDNGAGGRSVTHYTAPSIDGPWTQLGTASSGGSVSSIHSGTAPLDVGDVEGSGAGVLFPPAGRIYAFQLYDGIDGTPVADVDFTAQTLGDTEFTDDAGLTWTLEGAAEITDRKNRMTGEIPAWPPRRDLSGRNVRTNISPAGILRRLGQGNTPLQSVLRREMTAPGRTAAIAYWPCEDGESATSIASALGSTPMAVTGEPELASFDGFACSDLIPVLTSGSSLSGVVPSHTATGETQVRWLMHVDAGGGPDGERLLSVSTSGTAARWDITYHAGGALQLTAYDGDGALLEDTGNVAFAVDGELLRVGLELTQDGADIDYTLVTLEVDAPAGTAFSGTVTGETFGRVGSVLFAPDKTVTDVAVGHLAVYDTITTIFDLKNQLDAHNGEAAGRRIERLCEENEIPFSVGDPDGLDDTQPMGRQRIATLMKLLQDCAAADRGFLLEQRDTLGLTYRGRTTLYNQEPVFTLNFADGVVGAPFEMTDDDKLTENDVTVKREGGSEARAVLESGALSVQDPPDGVGRGYDVQHTLNLEKDQQAEPMAFWLLHLGTFEGLRYTKVTVDLANERVFAMIDDILRADVGDKIRLTNLPDDLPPDDVDLIIRGQSEQIGEDVWRITFNCAPGEPYTVATVAADDPADDGAAVRADTDGSELAEAAVAAGTEFIVHTPESRWVTSGGLDPTDDDDLPFDVRLGGEAVTATAITPLAWDAFGRVETDTWGDADSGHTWAAAGGVASDRSVDGSSGVITLQADPGTIRFQQIIETVADCQILVSITPDQLATGAAFLPAVLLRASGDYYRCRLVLGTDGSVSMQVTRVVTQVGDTATTPYTYSAGTKLWLRVRIDGQRVRGRVWPDGGSEPGAWLIDETVETDPIDSGAVGLTGSAFATNSNTNPAFAYDDFEVITPQRWTVTRSVNGIEKSQSAGADIRLAQPAITAL
ncbi:hypothetical protein AB0903_27395 [Streptomyces sp. NPDC048389]|uniref:hypothetical protein n=1 Tax=Streptomyces sp. NPDC048389 TaxID=3154622 RepID=UPI0034567F07